ncbi:hypothetical protein AB0J80_36775 [Actinoplanes sp. NPDC049548]|uniref:hypothetical protein n=1 Tax=Actinoplanes sp. NPDC049548 TaxID=3155152 RepID=UPI00344AA22D
MAAVLGMILLVSDFALWAYLASEGATGLSPMVRTVFENAAAFDLIYLLLVLGYVGGFVWWQHSTRQLLRRIGDSTGAAARHWAVGAWNGLIVAGFLIRFAITSSSGEPETRIAYTSLGVGLRVVAISLLLIGVWEIRGQVREAVADSGVVLRVEDMPARASAIPAQLLAAPAAPAPAADLPDADDEFWDRVRRTAAGLRQDLALLESSGPYEHRWLWVPASGDVTSARAAVAPDAVITIFSKPPVANEAKGFEPEPAEGYHGFLEDAESGVLWFQSVAPHRVPMFLARARSAARWGLYPIGDPTAITAVNRALRP